MLGPNKLAPSWLVSSVGRALHRYRRGHGFKSRTDLNFFRSFLQLLVSVVFFNLLRGSLNFVSLSQCKYMNFIDLKSSNVNCIGTMLSSAYPRSFPRFLKIG